MVVVTISILGMQVLFAEMLLPDRRLVLLQPEGLVGSVDKLLPRLQKLTRVLRVSLFKTFRTLMLEMIVTLKFLFPALRVTFYVVALLDY